LNVELFEQTRLHVPSVPQLVNMLSRRVRQLNAGMRPYIKPEKGDEHIDVAMREIVSGKMTAEIGFFSTTDKARVASETP